MNKVVVAEYITEIVDNGAESLIRDYAIMMDRSKIEPIVIVHRYHPESANEKLLRENNVKIIALYPHWNLPVRIIKKMTEKWYIPFKLNRIIKKEKIQVVHAHMRVLKYLTRVSKDVRLLYTCHNIAENFVGISEPREHQAAKLLIENNNLQMIALHDEMRKDINKIFSINSTVVVRNGVCFSRFQNVNQTKEQIREKIGVPKNKFVIGHVGKFFAQKNHEYLIDVFSEVIKKREDAFLLLVGAGELLEKITDKIKRLELENNVLILSHRSDIPELLKAMDVFLFPSLFEGLPVSLIEAQAVGLRCVCSDTINPEAFASENTIALSIKSSPSEWANVILDDSIKGKAVVGLDEYNMETEIKKLERLYLNGV
ncbi:MAG: glycosyltransferase family 1 protein [Lachnospiraceae bacterium]|nr:glycosyltransferase family 1 protein [Lachnospiraceae bacterium]